MRPLIERAAILSYLCANPQDIYLWKEGWKHGKRPSLVKMLLTMNPKSGNEEAKKICDHFNHLVHGDPIGALSNLVVFESGKIGYATSKIIADSETCDEICFQSYCYLIVIMERMAGLFPEANLPKI